MVGVTITARACARYLLAHQDRETGEPITNMKLQKLCYYAQGVSLAVRGRPLFRDSIKAWGHGPVIPSLWHEYREAGPRSLPTPEVSDDDYPADVREVLDITLATYGAQSAATLRSMTHEEVPWQDARALDGEIRVADLKAFFGPRAAVLFARGDRARPVDKVRVREILLADERVLSGTRRGISEVERGEVTELDVPTPG